MKYTSILLSIFIYTVMTLNAAINVTGTEAEENLDLRTSYNMSGDAKAIGNTIVWKDSPGTPTNRNNAYNMVFVDIDANATTFDSSSADLDLGNQGYEIIYARLYWQGHICQEGAIGGCRNDGITGAPGNNAGDFDNATSRANTIKIKGPLNNYQTVTSTDLHYIAQDNDHRILYSASADVINIVKTNGEGTYTVADLVTSEGQIGRWGGLGGWALVVIYKDLSGLLTLKNISLFHGFQVVEANQIVDVPISGFLTPKSGTVNSTATFFTVDGDKLGSYSTGETFKMEDANNGNTLTTISDALNPVSNQFNSTISNLGVDNLVRNPHYTDNLGYDLDTIDVSNYLTYSQTSTLFQFGNQGDLYNLSFILFTTELYTPKFCYDYAYKQQDVYFTEENDGSNDPKISGSVLPGEDVDVTLYIKNLVDPDFNVTNMYVDITDINTTQANYIPNSTKLSRVGQLYPTNLVDGVDVTVGTDTDGEYIKDINIGTIDSDEYFYTYYSINPNMSALDMPIHANARYTIIVEGFPFNYNLVLGSGIPICSTSNFEYKPAKGIFNIVHNNYYDYDIGGSNRYYNIPTQVTKREGNFKVISMDPDNLDDLKGISKTTTVAVEMIDASAFHDTNASCSELDSAISERIWVELDANTSATLFNKDAINAAIGLNNTITSAADFFSYARQNAAFRISYPISNDGNGSLIELSDPDANGYKKIENYSEIVQVVGACSRPVKYPLGASGNIGTATTAAQACGNSGTYLSPQHIQSCMECIYGYSTKLVCSRDNFSIRPEALLIKLDDQNQTNPTVQARIDDTISGVATPVLKVLNLSAGYQYNIEVNATNHLNNEASEGYTKTFNLDNSSLASYIFEPRSITVANANLFCNAPVDINLSHPLNLPNDDTIRILNGLIDTNTSIDQVGEYRLSLRDTSWTTVDSDLATMSHHIAPYFTANTDCYSNSGITQNVNAAMNPNDITTLNGCNISSSHTNNEANLAYNDYNVTFHPYKFDLNGTTTGNPITPTIGLPVGGNFTPVPALAPGVAAYIYISDINETLDENMSYHLNGNINALGENNVTLTNFVDQCYAVPLDINITTSNRDLNDSNGNHVDYRVRFHDINASNKVITALDINVTDNAFTSHTDDILLQTVQTAAKGYFPKNLNGRMQTRLNMNYAREKDTTINPTTLTFIKYRVNCTDATNDCTFNADLVNNKTTKGVKDLNATIPIRHYYGRTHAPRTTIQGSDGNVSMYYEVFCNGATCNKILLQDGVSSSSTDDPRWFVNTKHSDEAGTAAQTATMQKNAANVTITREADGNHPDFIGVHYNGASGYTYKATMENNASGWLIYNKYNPNAVKNEFEVEFVKPGGDWAGVHETNATTNKNATDNTNRRLMW